MEDTILTFTASSDQQTVTYNVSDTFQGINETVECPFPAFTKALAIAIHHDGMPDVDADYPEAESVQPLDSKLRWIP